MFFIWGRGGNRVTAGEATHQTCSTCNDVTQFNTVVDYRFFHLWYLFSFLTSRQYAVVCERCGHGAYITKSEFKQTHHKEKISIIRKWGWLISCLLMVSLVSYAIYSSKQEAALVNQYMTLPQVNDIYFADLAKINSSGYNSEIHAYGTMKLVGFEDEYYLFAIANVAYDKKKGIPKTLSTIEYVENDDEIVALTEPEIIELKNSNIIYDIRR